MPATHALTIAGTMSLALASTCTTGCIQHPPCAVPALSANTHLATRFEIATRMIDTGYEHLYRAIERSGLNEAVQRDKQNVSVEQLFQTTLSCANAVTKVLDLGELAPKDSDDGVRKQRLETHADLMRWYAVHARSGATEQDLVDRRKTIEGIVKQEPGSSKPQDLLHAYQLAEAMLEAMLHFAPRPIKDLKDLEEQYNLARGFLESKIDWGSYEHERSELLFVLDRTHGAYLKAETGQWQDAFDRCEQLRAKKPDKLVAKMAAAGVKDCDRWFTEDAPPKLRSEWKQRR